MSQNTIIESASLYFTEGSSDKVYQAQIKQKDDGYIVDFQYGRRGSTLTAGTKTATPVDLATANKTFAKLIAEKTKKGYTPDVSGSVFQDTENAGRVTGLRPQLPNPIQEEDLETYLCSSEWVAQLKHDGERRMAKRTGDTVIGSNNSGLEVPLPMPIVEMAQKVPFKSFSLDAEIIGDTLYVFDILMLEDVNLENTRLDARLSVMSEFFEEIRYALDDRTRSIDDGESRYAIREVRTAHTTEEKRALYNWTKQHELEGVVFKRKSSMYTPGRPSTGGDQVKFKFIDPASVEVSKPNEGKRSVQIRLYDENKQPIDVGNVTIPANHEIPAPGTIIEVTYLYAFKGGSLFQPVYKGTRPDQTIENCRLGQLRYKAEHIDDDFHAKPETDGSAPARPKG